MTVEELCNGQEYPAAKQRCFILFVDSLIINAIA